MLGAAVRSIMLCIHFLPCSSGLLTRWSVLACTAMVQKPGPLSLKGEPQGGMYCNPNTSFSAWTLDAQPMTLATAPRWVGRASGAPSAFRNFRSCRFSCSQEGDSDIGPGLCGPGGHVRV